MVDGSVMYVHKVVYFAVVESEAERIRHLEFVSQGSHESEVIKFDLKWLENNKSRCNQCHSVNIQV